jgi:TRAP-type mannitol/chloroaromatic compound transport system permease large subunit
MPLIVFGIAFVALLAIGVPVSIGLGGAAMAYVFALGDLSPTMLVMTTFSGMTAYPLLAIRCSSWGGNINERGRPHQGPRLVHAEAAGVRVGRPGAGHGLRFRHLRRHLRRRVATVVAIGMIMLPAMKQAGYDEEVSAGITATASCMGPIIPPSIPFILYGVIANVSIGALFLGGILPGCSSGRAS